MKRLLVLLLMVVLLLSMAACDREFPLPGKPAPEATNPTEKAPEVPQTVPPEPEAELLDVQVGYQYLNEWNNDYIQLAYVDWQCMRLADTSAARYPKLAAALNRWNMDQRDYAEDVLSALLPDAQDAAADMGMDFNGYMEAWKCFVQRADSHILSVRQEYEGYAGMRPYYGTACLNLDPKTGEPLQIDDVLTDVRQLPRLLEDALREKYVELPADTFDGMAEYLESYSVGAYTWTLGYQGVTFYFGVSELAASAVGELTATLWFDKYPDLFVSEYTQVPEGGYAVALSKTGSNEADLTPGDGHADRIYVDALEYEWLKVGRNDQDIWNEEYYGYDFDAYLVTPDNRNFYLYIQTSGANDYQTLYVYDLTEEVPAYVAEFPGDGFVGDWDDSYEFGTYFMNVFNDPSEFVVGTRIDLLGTMTGERVCRVSPASGAPFPQTEYFTLPEDRPPLISKVDLEVQILPEQKTETLPAGTRFRFLRTNGETYVDMLLDDGRECRVLTDRQGWMVLVNGIPEEDCFEGVMYAG